MTKINRSPTTRFCAQNGAPRLAIPVMTSSNREHPDQDSQEAALPAIERDASDKARSDRLQKHGLEAEGARAAGANGYQSARKRGKARGCDKGKDDRPALRDTGGARFRSTSADGVDLASPDRPRGEQTCESECDQHRRAERREDPIPAAHSVRDRQHVERQRWGRLVRRDQGHAPKSDQRPDRKHERIDIQKRNRQALSRSKGRGARDHNRERGRDANAKADKFHDANARQRGHRADGHIEFARDHRESEADGHEARHDCAVEQRRNADRRVEVRHQRGEHGVDNNRQRCACDEFPARLPHRVLFCKRWKPEVAATTRSPTIASRTPVGSDLKRR